MINPMNLSGQRILVTGASSGIGRAAALLLSSLGAKLVLHGRNRERLAETLSFLEGEGHACAPRELDQMVETIPEWVKDLASQGPLHGLVHSAGVGVNKPLRILKLEDIRTLELIHLESALMLIKGFRRKGVCAPGGSVVLISSVAAVCGEPGLAAYGAVKAALLSMTRTLARELAVDGLRINCILPGLVETPMGAKLDSILTPEQMQSFRNKFPLGFGKPEDVANLIAFLLSGASRWMTGGSLVIDGGYTS